MTLVKAIISQIQIFQSSSQIFSDYGAEKYLFIYISGNLMKQNVTTVDDHRSYGRVCPLLMIVILPSYPSWRIASLQVKADAPPPIMTTLMSMLQKLYNWNVYNKL